MYLTYTGLKTRTSQRLDIVAGEADPLPAKDKNGDRYQNRETVFLPSKHFSEPNISFGIQKNKHPVYLGAAFRESSRGTENPAALCLFSQTKVRDGITIHDLHRNPWFPLDSIVR